MAKTRSSSPSSAAKLPTKAEIMVARRAAQRKKDLSELVERCMPSDGRVLSMMTHDWLTAKLTAKNLVVTKQQCWQNTFDTGRDVVKTALNLKELRRRTKNLGSHRLLADSLLPPFKRFAGYLWREIHLAFNASPTAQFITVDLESSAAYTSNSASVYCYQIAAWINHAEPSERLQARQLQYQCSHLCNNRLCYNPDHIFLESAADNRAREACRRAETLGTEGGIAFGCVHGGKGRPYCVRSQTSLKLNLMEEGRTRLGVQGKGGQKVRKARVSKKAFKLTQ